MTDDVRICKDCGGPCKIPEFARDSSRFANDLFGFSAHMARVHQQWLDPRRLEEVARTVAATRALPVIPTFPCAVCKKFAFERDGVTCYWCGRGLPPGVSVVDVVLLPSEPGEPALIVTPPPSPQSEPAPVARGVKAKPAIPAPPSLFG